MLVTSSPAVDHTRLLIDAVQRLSVCRTVPEVVEIVKHAARIGADADGASFVLPDGDRCYYVDEDAIAPLWKGRRFPMSQCISGWAMQHRAAAVIPDIREDPRIPQDAYRVTFVRSLVMVPIRSREPFGAIGVYWAQPREPDRATVDWLQALADATCASLETIRALNEIAILKRDSSRAPIPTGEPVRMCAWTRRLWHNGQWLSTEAFLHERFGVEVSHGISAEAHQRLMSGLTTTSAEKAALHPIS